MKNDYNIKAIVVSNIGELKEKYNDSYNSNSPYINSEMAEMGGRTVYVKKYSSPSYDYRCRDWSWKEDWLIFNDLKGESELI